MRYLILLFFLLAACSGKKVDPNTREELPDSAAITIDGTEQDLFDASRELYERGLYTVVTSTLESLINNYPQGQYAEYARIKLADTYFQLRDFERTATEAETFIEKYQSSESLPYMLFLAAKSRQATYGGIGRDIAPLEAAAKYYREIVSKFPNSEYYQTAEKELVLINQDIAEYYNNIIAYYNNKGLTAAVKKRQARYDKFLAENNTVLPKVEKNKAAKGVGLKDAQPMELSALSNEKDFEPLKVVDTGHISSVECRELAGKIVVISLSDLKPQQLQQEFEDQDLFIPEDYLVKIPFDSGIKDTSSFDCFSNNKLKITNQEIELKTNSEIQVMVLEHPLRLVLVERGR